MQTPMKPVTMLVAGVTGSSTMVRVTDGDATHWLPASWLDVPAVMAGEWDHRTATLSLRAWPSGRVAANVSSGWAVWAEVDGRSIDSGPETGERGMALADACLRAAGHLPPLPEWVPAVGDWVEVATLAGPLLGVVRELIPARVAIRLDGGMGHEASAVRVRPAPQPAPRVALGWCDRVGAPGAFRPQALGAAPGQIPGGGRGWIIVDGATIDIPAHQVELVQRAYCDAHLAARGWTLEGGPVEGVRVRLSWRASATVEQVRACRADARTPDVIRRAPMDHDPVVCDGWCAVVAWLIAHPEAPIDWTIEAAP